MLTESISGEFDLLFRDSFKAMSTPRAATGKGIRNYTWRILRGIV